MEEFSVVSKDAEVLDSSHLVSELRLDKDGLDSFPVLIGASVAIFHDIEGGYHRSEGYHVVNLIHRVQGDGSPPSDVFRSEVELHLNDKYWYLEVADAIEYDEDYPDEDYVLSLKVTGYQGGPYSFSKQMQEEVDKRETRYEHES